MSPKRYEPRGLYFEDLEVGDTVVSPGRTVTETDLVLYCGLSGDYNEVHSNVEFAKDSMFGRRITHGPLGLIVAMGLASRGGYLEGTAQALARMDWRLKAPIFIGDTIHVQISVLQKRAVKSLGGGMVIFDVAILNQEDAVVQEGQWSILIKGRPATD